MKTTLKMILATAALTAGVSALAPMADARPTPPMSPAHQVMRNDQLQVRIDRMKARLSDGWTKRELNRIEYNRLNARLSSIISDKRRDDLSGRGLNPAEASRLNARLDDLSRDTFFQKHGFNG